MVIAWIGTGIMGAPMVRLWLHAGHRVKVFNRSPERARALSLDGATVCADPVEAVAGAEAVFIMVPDTPDVQAVAARIEPEAHPGQLVIDMSTVAPAAEREIAGRFAGAAGDVLPPGLAGLPPERPAPLRAR